MIYLGVLRPNNRENKSPKGQLQQSIQALGLVFPKNAAAVTKTNSESKAKNQFSPVSLVGMWVWKQFPPFYIHDAALLGTGTFDATRYTHASASGAGTINKIPRIALV